MKQEEAHRLLSRVEVAERFGISRRFLEQAAHRGEGPCIIRIGRSVRYRVSDIENWIDSLADYSGRNAEGG